MRKDVLHADEPHHGLPRRRVIERIADDVEFDDAAAFLRPRRLIPSAVDVRRRHGQRRLPAVFPAAAERIGGGGKGVASGGIFEVGEYGGNVARVEVACVEPKRINEKMLPRETFSPLHAPRFSHIPPSHHRSFSFSVREVLTWPAVCRRSPWRPWAASSRPDQTSVSLRRRFPMKRAVHWARSRRRDPKRERERRRRRRRRLPSTESTRV